MTPTTTPEALRQAVETDRSEAVNLARNLKENSMQNPTPKGICMLIDAVLSMDAALSALQSALDDAGRPDILEKLTYHRFERDDLTLNDCLTYLSTNGWHKVHGRTERQMILQLTELLSAAPAPQVQAQGIHVTEEMHRAAVKVLHRAKGLDGLPQRMLDAMMAVSHPPASEPAPSKRPINCGTGHCSCIECHFEPAPSTAGEREFLTRKQVDSVVYECREDGEDSTYAIVNTAIQFYLDTHAAILQSQPQGEVDQSNLATIAGLEASIGHLSSLVNEQLILLSDVNDVCGRDGHGGELEDGESEIIDRVRAHLAAIQPTEGT